MRLNKWLALLLAVLLCGALNGALAEADVALDGLAPEAASLEAPLLEDAGIPELEMPDGVELDVDAGPGGTEAPAGETVANWEPYELLHGETRDEHGNVIETYTYFYDEASNCYRILKGNNVRITELGYDVKYNTENITIPGKRRKYRVTEIGDNLLYWGPYTIRSITIPNTVKTIGKNAFQRLRGLKRVTIPKSVTSIGDAAFANCDYLTSVTVPGSVKTLGNGVFSGCTILAKVKLNKGLKTIGDYAFSGCAFSGITLPDTVTSIGKYAFSECANLKSIAIPKSVKNWGEGVCSGCKALTTATFKAGCTTVPKGMFYGLNLKKVTLPDSVTSIGTEAFYNCERLGSVKFPKKLKTIGESAFAYSGLKSAILPAKLKTLGQEAFNACKNLTTASVPLSVTKMGDNVFCFCDKLKKLTIDPKLFKNAYAYNVTEVVIPSGVKSIPASAFENEYSITQVAIPATVKTIGEKAFYNAGLTAVTIPASVTSIGASAFSGTKVTAVSIPSSVTGIGASAFSDCYKLATLTLNEGLKTIGARAFDSCNSLVTVVIPESVESIGDYAFNFCDSLASITIPRNTQLGASALPFNYDLTVRTYYNSPAEAYAKANELEIWYFDAPTSITLNFSGIVQLEKYKKLTLVPTLAPEGCAPYVTWKSSDTSVAEVSEEGEVSAYRIGKATITVYDANGELAASVDIEVVPPKPTSVSIDCWYDEIGVGETMTLYAYFDHDDAEATLTWSSSKTRVATVDKNGVVTGVSAGTAVITVTTDNGLSATQEITVVDY